MLIWIHHYWILIINNLNAILFTSTFEYLVALVQNVMAHLRYELMQKGCGPMVYQRATAQRANCSLSWNNRRLFRGTEAQPFQTL